MTTTTTSTTLEAVVRHLAGADGDLVLTVKRARSAYEHMLSAYKSALRSHVAGDAENEDGYNEMAHEYGLIFQLRVEKAAVRVNGLTGIDEALAASVIVSIVEE